MDWKERAIKTLQSSLKPVPIELNELDWKSGLSPKTERLAQHISAFANHKGGGVLVFGVNNDGTLFSVEKQDADSIVHKLGNIARNSLNQPIVIEHSIIVYEGCSLLFVYIPEQNEKPIYLKSGDLFNSFCRSAGQTVKMSQNHVKMSISTSRGIHYEHQVAKDNLTADEVMQHLHCKKFYELIDRAMPPSNETILNTLKEYNFCGLDNDRWYITSLGAILFANNLTDFQTLSGKSIIVRKYFGTNNREMEFEQKSEQGYAVCFDNVVDYIMSLTAKGEKRDTRRTIEHIYPRIAIREFVANAIIHQDFAFTGMQNAIEIFLDRLSITNPGAPLNDINQLIHLPPNSRNEILANTMYLLRFCEKRGSGIGKAFEAIEKHGLPAVKYSRSEIHTKITMYPAKDFKDMTKSERINACYQHACLLFEDNIAMNNQSVRERFGLDKNKSYTASRIINDTLEKGWIKLSDEDSESKKFATYVPYYG